MISLTKRLRGRIETPGRRVRGAVGAFSLALGIIVIAPGSAGFSQPGLDDREDVFDRDSEDERVLVVPIRQPITESAAESLRRRISTHLEDPRFRSVVFRFEAGGGDEQACESLASYIDPQGEQPDDPSGGLRSKTTVAWLPELREPLGAAVLVVMACKKIVLGKEAVLAALPKKRDESREEPEFSRQYRRLLDLYATSRRRPTLLARALIDREHDDILRVVYRRQAGAPEERGRWKEGNDHEVDFKLRGDYLELPRNVVQFEITDKEVVCAARTAFQVDAKQARRCMITEVGALSNIHDVLDQLGINVPPSSVYDLDRGALVPSSQTGQALIDFFNSVPVRMMLIVGGCLGLLLEIKMLGTMIAGASGLACFLILFVTSLFPVTGSPEGTGTVFEILLFFIGLGLLAVEFLLLPGVAVFALSGGALCMVSLVLIMVPPDSSSVAGGLDSPMNVKNAIWTLILGFGTGTAVFVGLLKLFPRWRLLGGGGLVNRASIEGVPTADSAVKAQLQITDLIGRTGIAETTLRPAGKVLLGDGGILDVVAEGDFIERGETVVVTGGSATRITVARKPESEGEKRQV